MYQRYALYQERFVRDNPHVRPARPPPVGDRFYLSLAPPWNILPDTTLPPVSEFKRLEGLAHKFDGHYESYVPWRNIFLYTVHQANAPISWKAQALIRNLDSKSARLRDIIGGLDATPDAYAVAIQRLEQIYGHPLGILGHRSGELDRIHFVREGDLALLRRLETKLADYLRELDKLNRPQDMFTEKLFEDLFSKLDKNLGQQYLRWHEDHNAHVRHNAVALATWLKGEVARQETAARVMAYRREGRRRSEERRQPTRAYITRRSRSSAASISSAEDGAPPGEGDPPGERAYTTGDTPKASGCPMCDEDHRLVKCDRFRACSPEERRNHLRKWRACYSCLEPGHAIRECKKGNKCSRCDKNHHTLLHDSKPSKELRKPSQRAYTTRRESDHGSDSEVVEGAFKAAVSEKSKVSLFTLPLTCSNPESGTTIDVNGLVDNASTSAFISKEAADLLGLKGRPCMTTLTGFNGTRSRQSVVIAQLKVSAPGAATYAITVQVVDDPASHYIPTDWTKLKDNFPHLRSIPVRPPAKGPVQLMIGQSTPHLIRALEPDRAGRKDTDPVAKHTLLGWTIAGPTGEAAREEDERACHVFRVQSQPVVHVQPVAHDLKAAANWQTVQFGGEEQGLQKKQQEIRASSKAVRELTDAVMQMYSLDEAAQAHAASPRDEAIFQYLRENMKKDEKTKRYQLPVLWKQRPPPLKNNYFYAENRLKTTGRHLQKRGEAIQQEYMANLPQWLEHGFVERCESLAPHTDVAHYICHFDVYRPDKLSTKLRIVLDGTSNATGCSLNEAVDKGPKLINELVEVLLRFRRHAVAFIADIEKMFHKIQMPEEDREFHRFLWWSKTDKPDVYRWVSHVFGNTGSPCVAIFPIKEHARRFRHRFPQAAETVIFSTLVDDNLDSRPTAAEAEETLNQLRALLDIMDMNIKKVVSNSKAIMNNVPEEEVSPSIHIADYAQKDNPLPTVKALGVVYDATEDVFSFTVQAEDGPWTKRSMLSQQARLYDPHGLVLPFTVVARILHQRAWREGLSWEDQLTEQLADDWAQWMAHLQLLPLLRIPRCSYDTARTPKGEQELHVFCDASADAYAAAAYIVTHYDDGSEPSARLLLAKARVAPLRQISIPRLELMGAELSVDIMQAATGALKIALTNVYYWSDSTNVLCWLKNDSRVLTSFVGTRVAKIQHHTLVSNWRWVPSEKNPADLPSRGKLVGWLAMDPLWWEGPAFLTGAEAPPEQPPVLATKEAAAKEIKKGAQFAFLNMDKIPKPISTKVRDAYQPAQDKSPLTWSSFTSWSRLLQVTIRCLRWRTKRRGPILTEERQDAERRVLRLIQHASFERTREELQGHEGLPAASRSALQKLTPQVHPDGLIHAHARLQNAPELSYEAKFPIILPKDHPAVPLLIRETHQQLAHAGANATLAQLLTRFWPIHGRALVRKVVLACVPCRRQRPKALQQIMAPLPEFRLPTKDSRFPFTHIGVDMAGPFKIRENKYRPVEKHYFILVTCLVTRAVHLEPVTSASLEAFLAAFQRFTARRCPAGPVTAICDNGSNLAAGSRAMAGSWTEADLMKIQEKDKRTEWRFNPPTASHFGGAYERLIGLVKRHLYHALPPDQPSRAEEFSTALVVVEGILNSRPLTYVSEDPQAPLPLTPADVLGIAPFREAVAEPVHASKFCKRWHHLQQRLDKFWERFRSEVLPYMQASGKWQAPTRDLTQGDVVLLLDDPRKGKWPLALVRAVEEGEDGHVRSVLLKVPSRAHAGGLLRRPITKVALLLPEDRQPHGHQA